MAPYSSTLAWKIPWTEEPGRLQSMGSLELHTTERLHFHFSLSCIGEGNGNPLQRSWLENPRDGGAWWAAVYGVAQSWTRLKRFSSSSMVAQTVNNLPAMQETQVQSLGQEDLILCCSLLHLPSILPSMSVFSNEWAIHIAAAAKSLQSCPTLCNPVDGSPPGSPSLGFTRQELWSGLPFPSPMHESEK